MREIKFRAWDTIGKQWLRITGFETAETDVSKGYTIFGKGAGLFHDGDYVGSEGIILSQYTGLKDKNGKEIYEGDILLVTSEIYTNFGKTPTGSFSKEYYEVIWKDDGWGHKVLKSNHTIEGTEIKGLKVTTKYVEVIGNIYENHELLEESK